MNKNIIGARIQDEKDKIIELYDYFGEDILDIAEEYQILPATMCKHLYRWGIKVRKGDYGRERLKAGEKRKISKTLQKQRDYNTMVNNKKIKFIDRNELLKEKELHMIENIIDYPIDD